MSWAFGIEPLYTIQTRPAFDVQTDKIEVPYRVSKLVIPIFKLPLRTYNTAISRNLTKITKQINFGHASFKIH